MLPDLPCRILDELTEPGAVLGEDGVVVYANAAFKALGVDPFASGAGKGRERWRSLMARNARRGRETLRKPRFLVSGERCYDLFVYVLNKPGDEARFYCAVLKGCGQEGAVEAGTPDALRGPGNKEPFFSSERLAPEFEAVRGEEPVFRKALLTAQKAARTDFPVLIVGESGTGKEILARAIHKAGRRGAGEFVDINCAAIPDNLIESELFGYERGAFTGAGPRGRRGLFEEAHGGSIFLDEIGDASLPIQSKILRVLEEGRFKRIGSNRNLEVDVRHISATNRDLNALIREGRFREDLLYRLNTITIELPPLRSRPGDIPLLIEHFMAGYARREGKRILFSSECLEILEAYSWPGNVRELKGVVDYAVTMATDSVILPDCLPSFLFPPPTALPGKVSSLVPDTLKPEANASLPAASRQLEKEMIRKALAQSANRSEAIRALGISRRTFYLKIKQYGLG